MGADDPSVDEAVPGTEEAPAAAGEAEAADAEQGSSSLSTKEKWREALNRYLEGSLTVALKLVDEILEEDPDTELRPRLERLKRRALDRVEKQDAEEPGAKDEGGPAGDEASNEAPSETPAAEEARDEAEASEAPAAEAGAPTESTPTEPEVEFVGEADDDESEPSGAKDEGAKDEGAKDEGQGDEVKPEDAKNEAKAEAEAKSGEAAEPEVVGEAAEAAEAAEDADAAPVAVEEGKTGEGAVAPTEAAAKRNGPEAPAKDKSGRQRRPQGRASGPRRVVRRPGGPPGAGAAVASGTGPIPRPGVDGAAVERLQTSVEKLGRNVRVMEANLVKIAEAYQRVAKDGRRKDQAYDQLYEELRQNKDNFLLTAQKPLFKDLVLLYDGMTRTLKSFKERAGDDPIPREEVESALEHLRDEVLEVLYRRDIERIDEQPDKLDIEIQKPVRRVETDDPAEDKTIAQVVRDGFRLDGVVFRPQEVVVRRCLKKEKETRS